jgi:hypothetical protein
VPFAEGEAMDAEGVHSRSQSTQREQRIPDGFFRRQQKERSIQAETSGNVATDVSPNQHLLVWAYVGCYAFARHGGTGSGVVVVSIDMVTPNGVLGTPSQPLDCRFAEGWRR